MLTVTRLARRYGISRTTILYYERQGLLLPAHRSENGYRWYSDAEIERLEAIVTLLREPTLMQKTMVTKDRWVEIMKAAGFDEASMVTWHQKFEQMEPEEHQKFLESPGIEADEITQVRSL